MPEVVEGTRVNNCRETRLVEMVCQVLSKIIDSHENSFVVENPICMDSLVNIGLFASGVGLTSV